MGLKTGDLDLQGQIGLKTSTVFSKNGTVCHYIFKLERYIDHLLVPSRGWLGGGARHLFLVNAKRPSLELRIQNYLFDIILYMYNELSYFYALTTIGLHIRILVLTIPFNNII